ncbi:MAG: hypothetical protein ACLRM8_04665 [Alistipes sp.]
MLQITTCSQRTRQGHPRPAAEFAERLHPWPRPITAPSGDREQIELHYKSELNDRPFEEIPPMRGRRHRQRIHDGRHSPRRPGAENRGYPLRKYGSQGQQKSFLIALKLAQYTIVAREKGEKPILLLDDLFDKLDAGRVEQLIRLVSEDSFGQILITDRNPTRLRTILDKAGGEYALFTVGNGAVTQGNATATAAAADPDKGSAGSRPGNAAENAANTPENARGKNGRFPRKAGKRAIRTTRNQPDEQP